MDTYKSTIFSTPILKKTNVHQLIYVWTGCGICKQWNTTHQQKEQTANRLDNMNELHKYSKWKKPDENTTNYMIEFLKIIEKAKIYWYNAD